MNFTLHSRSALAFLAFLASASLVPAATAGRAPAARPATPNIILILTDDLGWGDVGVFFQNARHETGRGPAFATPTLDRVAAEGARLTQHYSAAPVCAPSRASLLLGVHQGHANVRDNQFDKALEANHTLATVLRRAGYATALIGKWGLHGQTEQSADGAHADTPAHPLLRGFESFFGYLRHVDGHEQYPKEAPYFIGAKRQKYGPVKLWDNRTDVTAQADRCYSTDLFTARAKQFIARHAAANPAQPFFLFLSYTTPHIVLELPTQAYPAGGGLGGGVQWLGKPGRLINTATGPIDSWTHPACAEVTWDDDRDPATPARPWPEVFRRHATSVRRIDDAVADLLQLLADLHLDEKTLVVFSSDNGPEKVSSLPIKPDYTPEFFASYGPFDGIKRDLWEGGIRVPTIVRWPGRIPAGRIVDQPNAQWDWLPTFADAAGLPPPALADGVSLLPALTGQGRSLPRRPLYFEYKVAGRTPEYPDFETSRRNRLRNQMQAIRLGELVGVRYDVKSAQDAFEIYNVIADPKQARNLAADPTWAPTQSAMQAAVLQSRRPNASAPRPYDGALVPALAPVETRAGVAWHAYPGPFPWVPDFAALSPAGHGTSPQIDPADLGRGAEVGGCFSGCLRVPADGDYEFHLTADTGAVLRLHESMLIDADFGHTRGATRTASIRLQAGLHPFRLSSIHRGPAAPILRLEWSGPGLERQPVPADAFCLIASRSD